MARKASDSRERGTIERRGNSLRVRIYAGIDPLTGKRLYLSESARDEADAKRVLDRLRVQVADQQNARTRATLATAMKEWLASHDVEENTKRGYEGYLRRYIEPAIGDVSLGRITAKVLEVFYAELRRCRLRCDGKPFIEHRVDGPHECRTVVHRRPPGRPPTKGRREHDCEKSACKVIECQPHRCVPLAPQTIRQIHFAISSALSAAVRWDWIKSNPAAVAKKPSQPAPQPKPPSADEANRIVSAAWEQDADWGTLVWLVMVTGMRRAELLALKWADIDLSGGAVTISRNYVRVNGEAIEKDTKTHQIRRISLDPATITVLVEHRQRYEEVMDKLEAEPADDAYLFSHRANHDRPYDPSGVSHRYQRMCAKLGIKSHLHALRHYSATELLTAGVDLRTVAGRLGHGGGGATTLRVYAAWVAAADRKAAEILASRMPRRTPPR